MSRRTTKCLTWGETRRSGCPLTDENGQRVGFLDFEEWVTLCGKPDDDPSEACALDHLKARPVGVCPACWKKFRADTIAYLHMEAERARTGEVEPANRENALLDMADAIERQAQEEAVTRDPHPEVPEAGWESPRDP